MISIIVPIFNGENFIKNCYNSLINQTSSNWEVIFIDDGSTDNTWEILKQLKKNHMNHCKIIHQNNEGQISARQNGINIANGNYCMFLDVDDTFEKHTIEIVTDSIKKYEPDIIIFDGYRIKNNSKLPFWEKFNNTTQLYNLETKNILQKQLVITKRLNNLCFKAVKKNLLDISNKFTNMEQVKVEEDLLMQLDLFDKAEKILYLPIRLYNYTFNPNSITNSFVKERYIAAACVNKYLSIYAEKWNIFDVETKLDERYYIEVCESVRQLRKYRFSLGDKINYIKKVSRDSYFQMKYNENPPKVNCKRKLLLFCLKYKLWPVILFTVS